MKSPHIKLINISDAEALHQLVARNKETLARFFPVTVSKNKTLAASKNYTRSLLIRNREKEFYPLGIFQEEKLIGMMLVKNIDWRIPKCEFGYYLDKAYYGQGIMTNIVQQTLDYCFEELKMRKVFLRISLMNHGSKRIAEKNGFIKEGILRDEFKIETGEIIDVIYYGKLVSD